MIAIVRPFKISGITIPNNKPGKFTQVANYPVFAICEDDLTTDYLVADDDGKKVWVSDRDFTRIVEG